MKLVLALCALFAVPASAATYRIDVTGQFTSIRLDSVFAGEPIWAFVDLGELEEDSPILSDLPIGNWITARTGSAIWSDDFTGCSGLLTPLCSGRGYLGQGTQNASGDYFVMRLSESELYYVDSYRYTFEFDGIGYGAGGVTARGITETRTITSVPIPASWLMLLPAILYLPVRHRLAPASRTAATAPDRLRQASSPAPSP